MLRVYFCAVLLLTNCCEFSLAAAEVQSDTADTQPVANLVAGQVRSFTAPGETGVTWHAYAPRSYKPADQPPLLILFSPAGDGKRILEQLKESVEASGWLLVGCDGLRNGMKDGELETKMEDEVLDDIFARLPHNPNRIYLGGFSGGGWRAYHLTKRRPEPVAGILAFGGWLGGPSSQKDAYREGMSIAMVNGLHDEGANAWMPTDTESLRKRNCVVKHFACLGGHKIAPPPVTAVAIAWLDEQWVAGADSAKPVDDNKIKLKVLYVGQPGDRADDFSSFLSNHFHSVDSISPEDCTLEQANAADVLLLDATVRSLPERCTRAMVMIGSSAAMTAERYGSKIDWLCQCLDDEAYHVNTAHPIFAGPLPVTPTLESKTCPHKKFEIQAWKVQSKQETSGLVSSRRYFKNAGDSDIIAGGVNMKGIHGVALVREAHRLLWGFIAPPSDMTPEAQKVFVNALVWIQQFDGHQQAQFAGMTERDKIPSLLDSPYIDHENLIRWFPQKLLDETDNDKEKIREHFAGRMAYVYAPLGSGQLQVDALAEKFETPNNEIESLEKWIVLLDSDDDEIAKAAKRLLIRYTRIPLRKSKQWREWMLKNKDQLSFDDQRGYRFYVDVAKDDQPVQSSIPLTKRLKPSRLSDLAPVQFDCKLASTHRINGLDYQFKRRKVDLVIRASVKDDWFFYPLSDDHEGSKATQINVVLPEGMTFEGEWQITGLADEKRVEGKLFDGVVFRRKINVGKPSSEHHAISGTVKFQACTEERCLQSQQLKFQLPLHVIKQ